jgi:hypothetical protein
MRWRPSLDGSGGAVTRGAFRNDQASSALRRAGKADEERR